MEEKDPHWYSKKYKEKHNIKFRPSSNLKVLNRINSNGRKIEPIIEKKVEKTFENIETEIKKDYEEIKDYITEPKHIKILKTIVLTLVILILGYLIYQNFLVSQEFNYFYDLGSTIDSTKPYLSPLNRISDISNDSLSRNLTSGLVYFDVPIARGSEKIYIETKISDNFPKNTLASIGAQDQDVWHYLWKPIYNPALNDLSDFEKKENVYRINPQLEILNISELKQQEGIVIATDTDFLATQNIPSDYKNSTTIISISLRGKHTFYIYVKGDLNIQINKQDINWYEGEDILEISLYDLNNNLITNTTIEDDGIINISNKKLTKTQVKDLQVENLKEGVYKLEFSDFDGLIKGIKINTNKIVSNKLFLSDSSVYKQKDKTSKIYTKANKNTQIKLITYHSAGLQNITYNNKSFNFSKIQEPQYLNLTKGEYNLSFPKNDIIIESTSYFAFSKENYFEPFKQTIIPIPNDLAYIKQNVDYLITDFTPPIKENNWIITSTEFSIKEDKLIQKNNKQSFVFNIPHLSNEQYQNNTIPIDWIKITVYKPGLLEKYKFWSYQNG